MIITEQSRDENANPAEAEKKHENKIHLRLPFSFLNSVSSSHLWEFRASLPSSFLFSHTFFPLLPFLLHVVSIQ